MSYNGKNRSLTTDNGSVEKTRHSHQNHHHQQQQQQHVQEEDEQLRQADEERARIVARYKLGREPGAEIDPWEDPSFEVYHVTDRYGFMHDSRLPDTPTADELKHREHEFLREKKWLQMVAKWSQLRAGKDRRLLDKFRSRVYKGVPHKLRGRVWQLLLNVDQEMEKNRGRYQEMCDMAHKCSPEVRQIDLDVNRTYRDHIMFRQRYDIKQTELFNVLAAYSIYNSELGYCQGMSQIAALLLMFLNEEEAFWALSVLMSNKLYAMHGMFIPGFPKLMRFQSHHDKILKKYMPKLKKHLDKNGVDAGIYTLKWFFQCFLDRVPFTLALRFWDVFLLEGDCILTAASFTILKMHKRNLIRLSMEEILDFLQVRLQKSFGFDDDTVITEMERAMDDLRRAGNLSAGVPGEAELPSPTPAPGTLRSHGAPAGSVSTAGASALIAELQQQQQRNKHSQRSVKKEQGGQNTSIDDTGIDEIASLSSSVAAANIGDDSYLANDRDTTPTSADGRSSLSVTDRIGSSTSALISTPHRPLSRHDDNSSTTGCNGVLGSRTSPSEKVSIYVPYPAAVTPVSSSTSQSRLPAIDGDSNVSDSALKQIDDALNQVLDAAVDLSLEPQITIQQQRHSGTTRVTIRQTSSPSPIQQRRPYTPPSSLSPSLSPISPARAYRSSRSSSSTPPAISPRSSSGVSGVPTSSRPLFPPISSRSQPGSSRSEQTRLSSPPPRVPASGRPFSASFQDGVASGSECHVWIPHAAANLPPIASVTPALSGSLSSSKYMDRRLYHGDSGLVRDGNKSVLGFRAQSPPVPPARSRSAQLSQTVTRSPPNHTSSPPDSPPGAYSRL